MPTTNGLVGKKSVTVLRDTGCSGVIVKRELVARQLTGKIGYVMMVACTLLKASFASVEVSTPYYSKMGEALCLRDPLYELIIGNIPGDRAPDDPDDTWCVKAAVITRSQARTSTETKLLKVADVPDQLAIAKNRLTQLQEEDLFFLKYTRKKGQQRKKKSHEAEGNFVPLYHEG